MPHNLKKTLKEFKVNGGQTGKFYSLPQLGKELGVAIERLPVSIRIVLESVLRNCDGKKVTEEIQAQSETDGMRRRPRDTAEEPVQLLQHACEHTTNHNLN